MKDETRLAYRENETQTERDKWLCRKCHAGKHKKQSTWQDYGDVIQRLDKYQISSLIIFLCAHHPTIESRLIWTWYESECLPAERLELIAEWWMETHK